MNEVNKTLYIPLYLVDELSGFEKDILNLCLLVRYTKKYTGYMN